MLTHRQVAQTADAIVAMQEPDGAIPWTTGDRTDVWDHVECAMALVVGGRHDAAMAAYDWCMRTQRPDGSWPMTVIEGVVDDASTESNMTAYLAVGVLHHWRVCRDRAFVERMWPVVRRALDLVVSMQLPFGGVAWSRAWGAAGSDTGPGDAGPGTVPVAGALLAGSSSIYQALRCGVALAELMDDPQPDWEMAGARLGHALRDHREGFLDKSTYSMDWYYPVLGGAVRGEAAEARVADQWETFVVDGLGVRCVSTNPWVTGAETCELVMALAAIDDHRAARLFADMQHLRTDEGAYWTGLVYPEHVNWPQEHSTFTAAAVILAWDVLTGTTPGAGVMSGREIGVEFPDALDEIALECDCRTASRVR
ncbi:prenyltransferase [Aeromicrobium sp. CTD01-1L150]|uniref:prenyltransferase n=1 Tax=Aeromicrobium sp. CTD01-1L150 TaxID=3341830 RepID=UPI0035C1E673